MKAVSIQFRYLQYLWESGINFYYVKKYFPKTYECNPKQRGKTESFTLQEFSGIFSLFIIGIFFSSLAFFIELILGFVQKKKKQFTP